MRFIMLMKGDKQSEAAVMPSNEIVAAMMTYNQALVDAGALLAAEGLRETARGARVKFHAGKPTVTDGPFVEAKDLIAGYWLIQAPSVEQAAEWAKRVPFEAGESSYGSEGTGQVELRPVFELEDFPVNEQESGWREWEAEQRAQTPAQPTARPGLKQFVVFRMADRHTEAGELPGEDLLTAMGRYNEELVNAGVMLTGEGLKPSADGVRVFYRGGKRTVVDGPFTETKDLIAGFSMIQARSLAEAVEWVKRWPAQDADGEVELQVREVFMADDFAAELPPELKQLEERQRQQIAARQ
jgi:hypothetical protein